MIHFLDVLRNIKHHLGLLFQHNKLAAGYLFYSASSSRCFVLGGEGDF